MYWNLHQKIQTSPTIERISDVDLYDAFFEMLDIMEISIEKVWQNESMKPEMQRSPIIQLKSDLDLYAVRDCLFVECQDIQRGKGRKAIQSKIKDSINKFSKFSTYESSYKL